jgi:hypothetical protein
LVDIVLNREQMDRMLVIKGADLKPVTRVTRAAPKADPLGGRAALIKKHPSE